MCSHPEFFFFGGGARGPGKFTLIFMWKRKSGRVVLKALKLAAITKHSEGKLVLPGIKASQCYSNLKSVPLVYRRQSN